MVVRRCFVWKNDDRRLMVDRRMTVVQLYLFIYLFFFSLYKLYGDFYYTDEKYHCKCQWNVFWPICCFNLHHKFIILQCSNCFDLLFTILPKIISGICQIFLPSTNLRMLNIRNSCRLFTHKLYYTDIIEIIWIFFNILFVN